MNKSLAKYLGNILWFYIYQNTTAIETVSPKWIDGVIDEIEKTELELIKLGVSEKAITRLIKMCEDLSIAYKNKNPNIPINYKKKIEKIIFSTPHTY